MSDKVKSLLFRLRNGFVSGFLGVFLASSAYTGLAGGNWDFANLEKAVFAASAAGIGAVILALDKWIRDTWDVKY